MPQSSSLAATIFAWARPRRSHDRAQSSTARHHGQRQHYTAAGIEPTERNRPQPDTTDKANTTPQQAFEPTEPNRPQSDTVDNANTTPQQAFGPIEATNALVGNAFFGNTNINFNGALSEVPGARAEKDACLKSLALGEIHTRRHDIAVAHPDTCDWLFRTPEFRQWRDPNSRHHHFGVLWIKGKPGAGKSTLMKHAFSCFQEDMFDGHLVVAHFFNARGATIEKTSLGLLRSIVYQPAFHFKYVYQAATILASE
ncbi:ankyrin repeat domain-containing protein 50 [Microdochium nivale]|nr:ankyrin repeat domain-containing protein 50 [Microdochium nivale]